MAISEGNDPTERWMVQAIESDPPQSTGIGCGPVDWRPQSMLPKVSYDANAVYLATKYVCVPLSLGGNALWALDKGALYSDGVAVKAAVYAQPYITNITGRPLETRVNFIQPARPQAAADVARPAIFVSDSVNYTNGADLNTALVVHTILDSSRLASMTGMKDAPRLYANTISLGFNFPALYTVPSQYRNLQQPGTEVGFSPGGRGMIQYNGMIYLTLSRFFFGSNSTGFTPAVYWAFVRSGTPDLCVLERKAAGVVTSKDITLGLSYATIAGRADGGARLVYGFSGSNELPHGLGAPYAGVASTFISAAGRAGTIDIIRIGHGAYECGTDSKRSVCSWGEYSAVSFWDNQMWTATTAARIIDKKTRRGSWITVDI